MKRIRILLVFLFALLWAGCSGNSASFNLTPATQEFMQNDLPSGDTIDILWLIDNSLSMQTSQDNLRANFDSFFAQFASRNLNFHMSVATSDAYRALYTGDSTKSLFRNADQFGTPSGFSIVDPATPNLHDVMLLNLNQGVAGNGDERAFQSVITALQNPGNAGFRRNGAFLAIIILSDEDDFSVDQEASIGGDYSSPLLKPISFYTSALDTYTSSSPTNRRYSVSSINIMDQACMDLIGGTGQKFGVRYQALASATDGFVGSLCGNFADTLDKIGKRILELLTAFPLERIPKVETITVAVDGVPVVMDPTNGWTYDSGRNSIVFHGTAVPAKGSRIAINYQPLSTKQ
jgi:hypothetical protein